MTQLCREQDIKIHYYKHAQPGSFRSCLQEYPYVMLFVIRADQLSFNSECGQVFPLKKNQQILVHNRHGHVELYQQRAISCEWFEIGLTCSLLNALGLTGAEEELPWNNGPFQLQPTIKAQLYRLLEAEDQYPPAARVFQRAMIAELLYLLLQTDCTLTAEEIKPRHKQIASGAKKILDNWPLSNKITIGSLAQMLQTNEATLKQCFKRITGFTIANYLHERRMNIAKEMLLEGKTVGFVSGEVGYSNISHFSFSFKKFYGIEARRIIR